MDKFCNLNFKKNIINDKNIKIKNMTDKEQQEDKNNKIENKSDNLKKKIMELSPSKTKLDKNIILDIELYIQTLKLNGQLNNEDITNNENMMSIAQTIYTIINEVHGISNKKLDCMEKINELLKKSIVIPKPSYSKTTLNKFNVSA